jgi:aspartyl-tRNA(Asn)/glutamyl-tRNA(Gln) amidotransferase subunit A
MAEAAPHELSIAEAGRALRDGSLTATELAEHALARVASLDPALDAFVLVTRERALADAARADGELRRGIDRGPMHGIPYGLKDIYDTAGLRTTGHSHLRADVVPTADSDVAARLAAGGGVLVGKLATHEFAIGGPSFDLPFPPARNPWNRDHIPGGSSSGSGAAVAAGMVRMAMGSDTGGSIRGPACYCGIVGLKPTYGRVSRRGVFPLSYSLDHCGPLTRTVEDTALVMQVIAGHDPLDPMSADVPVPDFGSGLGQRDLHGVRLAYPRRFFAAYPHTAPEVIAAMDAAVETLSKLGARVDQVELPRYELFEACGRVILIAEAYAIHEQDLKTRPLAYGRYAYQRIAAGAVLSAADLVQAHRLKRELATLVNRQVLAGYDGLVTAIGLSTAPRFDQFDRDIARWTTMHAIPFNVTGNPALSVPIGFSPDGLPLGMQIVGRLFDEPTVLRIGAAYEAATEWHRAMPPMADAAH